ncbi:MAG: cytochrome c biogenesis protein CcsA [Acidobacteriota bacterium]
MLSEISRKNLLLARRLLKISTWLAAPLYLLFVVALYLAFIYAPTERVMGQVQRIFYFHVGAAWNAMYVCFALVFLSGILYLPSRKRVWDQVAASAAEIGLAFTTITLLTGIFWARPIWGTWWPWGDPRVTSVLAMWLVYMSYMIFRANLDEGEKKSIFCAVFGIIGFINVIIVTISIRIWRTIHPVVITMNEMKLESEMVIALMVAVVAFTVLFMYIFCLRLAMRLHAGVALEMLQEAPQGRV